MVFLGAAGHHFISFLPAVGREPVVRFTSCQTRGGFTPYHPLGWLFSVLHQFSGFNFKIDALVSVWDRAGIRCYTVDNIPNRTGFALFRHSGLKTCLSLCVGKTASAKPILDRFVF